MINLSKDNKSKIVKQKIKCLRCGKKTVQQQPQKYNSSFWCHNCDIMWKVTAKPEDLTKYE